MGGMNGVCTKIVCLQKSVKMVSFTTKCLKKPIFLQVWEILKKNLDLQFFPLDFTNKNQFFQTF